MNFLVDRINIFSLLFLLFASGKKNSYIISSFCCVTCSEALLRPMETQIQLELLLRQRHLCQCQSMMQCGCVYHQCEKAPHPCRCHYEYQYHRLEIASLLMCFFLPDCFLLLMDRFVGAQMRTPCSAVTLKCTLRRVCINSGGVAMRLLIQLHKLLC